MIRRREKMKKENLKMTSDIFEKRYLCGDFEGRVLAEVQAQKPVRLALQPNQVVFHFGRVKLLRFKTYQTYT
jgi:hypothetical protein